MTRIKWVPDPDPVTEGDLIAMSGQCQIGVVSQSRSGRWRFEIVSLPDDNMTRDERRDWCGSEELAKFALESRWEAWLKKAGLI